MRFYDENGEFTVLGTRLRVTSLVVGVFSGLALIPATLFGLLSGMLCDGGCSSARNLAVMVMTASPLLFLMSTMAGCVALKSPSWPLILLAIVPPLVAIPAFAVGYA
jgi:hypothetical protein